MIGVNERDLGDVVVASSISTTSCTSTLVGGVSHGGWRPHHCTTGMWTVRMVVEDTQGNNLIGGVAWPYSIPITQKYY